MIGFRTLLYREVNRFIRLANQTILPPVIIAILYLLIFGKSLGDRIGDIVDGVSYIHFIIPGLVMMSVISAAYQNTSSSFFIQRFQRSLDELLVSSMSNFQIVFAIVLGGVARGTLVGILVSLICVILVPGTEIASPFLALFFILMVALIFSCMGFISTIWAESFDRLSLFQTYLLTPLIYLGGVFFRVSDLPGFWQIVARANPILYFVNGVRCGFLGVDVSEANLGLSVLISLSLAGGLLALCHHLFRIGYNIKS